LGSPAVMTDSVGSVFWQADKMPFGETLVTSVDQTALGFPGQCADQESGYSYNYFRDYDPTLGRYIQSDPIGLGGGVNTYGYVAGNPVVYFDPTGLEVVGASFGAIFTLPGTP